MSKTIKKNAFNYLNNNIQTGMNMTNTISFFSTKTKHPFHIVTNSPWPLYVSISVFVLTLSFVAYMHNYTAALFIFIWAFVFLVLSAANWWFDVIMEATYEGKHTLKVQKMYNTAITLFLISELFFFLGLFWTSLHFTLQPPVSVGASAIALNLENSVVSHIGTPALLNATLLLSSLTVGIAHHHIDSLNKKYTLGFLLLTILLGFTFSVLQYIEYKHTPIDFTNTNFGAILYLLTGFHGSHVIIGTFFLSVAAFRIMHGNITSEHRLGFEFAVIYWHFVDLIWLFVVYIMYISRPTCISTDVLFQQDTLSKLLFEKNAQGIWLWLLLDSMDILLLPNAIGKCSRAAHGLCAVLLIDENNNWVYPLDKDSMVLMLEYFDVYPVLKAEIIKAGEVEQMVSFIKQNAIREADILDVKVDVDTDIASSVSSDISTSVSSAKARKLAEAKARELAEAKALAEHIRYVNFYVELYKEAIVNMILTEEIMTLKKLEDMALGLIEVDNEFIIRHLAAAFNLPIEELLVNAILYDETARLVSEVEAELYRKASVVKAYKK